jgi:hypothetical protein
MTDGILSLYSSNNWSDTEESSVTEITNEASKVEESTTVDEPNEAVEVLSPEELEKVSFWTRQLGD